MPHISSGFGQSPVMHQAITWTGVDLSSFGTLCIDTRKILNKILNNWYHSIKYSWEHSLYNANNLAGPRYFNKSTYHFSCRPYLVIHVALILRTLVHLCHRDQKDLHFVHRIQTNKKQTMLLRVIIYYMKMLETNPTDGGLRNILRMIPFMKPYRWLVLVSIEGTAVNHWLRKSL